MSKELFIKLSEELGRDPTDDEMTDAHAAMIDNAMNYRDDMMLGGNIIIDDSKKEQIFIHCTACDMIVRHLRKDGCWVCQSCGKKTPI